MKYLTNKNVKLILRLLFTNPDKKYYLQELARLIGKKAGVLQKAANYLVKEKIALDERKGNLRFFFINKNHPLYPEMKKIIFKTLGVEGSLRAALQGVKNIAFAFLYGSFAKDSSDAYSDIDLCLIGNMSMRKVNSIVKSQEKNLQREINYLLYSVKEFRNKFYKNDHFVHEILKGAIFLTGANEELTGKT